METLFDFMTEKPRCTACNGPINTGIIRHVGSSNRRDGPEASDIVVGLVGCSGCGHAMVLDCGALRNLTRDEAKRVPAKEWIETGMKAVPNKWG